MQVSQLFETQRERLRLEWVAGLSGGTRKIVATALVDEDRWLAASEAALAGERQRRDSGGAEKSLVGHLNLIHPNQVQILGPSELRYLGALRSISRRDALEQLLAQQPCCVIVGDGQPVPEPLMDLCDQAAQPLFVSPLSSNRLTDLLHHFLTGHFAEIVTLHGVYLEVATIGVLLTGPAGVGKSELALELITRGHRLIADDAPQFFRIAPEIVNGACPEALQDFLEVRGIGILNVRQLFGDGAIKKNKYLRLIIRLEPATPANMEQLNRFEGSYRDREILDVQIPEITLPVAPGRNLAVLVECAARNHILKLGGYRAAQDFAERQQRLIDASAREPCDA
ncbi:MAG: HPr(Ser) kinase/phosphatase [Gammaproteobacteria bacterium]|nr:HPr(Ser) kinase/phosphatase [Gammaproteobacteria bacterium]